MSITIKGRTIMKGNVQAEAVVTRTPLSFTYIDPDTGKVADKTHELYGQTIKGKILVLPSLKGSAHQPFTLYQLVKSGIAPRDMVAVEADSRLIASAIFCEIPLMDKLEKDPLEAIKTGDLVRINTARGTVEIEN